MLGENKVVILSEIEEPRIITAQEARKLSDLHNDKLKKVETMIKEIMGLIHRITIEPENNYCCWFETQESHDIVYKAQKEMLALGYSVELETKKGHHIMYITW